MSVPQAGPSQPPPQSQLQQQAAPPYPGVPSAQADLKRRAEAEADAARRLYEESTPPSPPPHVLASLVPNSPAFNELLKIEQKLDWTLMRKKAELNDALGKTTRVKRTLRVYVSHTAHDQPWQKEEAAAASSLPADGDAAAPAEGAAADTASGASAGEGAAAGAESVAPKGDVMMSDGAAPASVAATAGETKKLSGEEVDVNTGKGVAGWILKVEGRLLDSGNVRLDKTKRKFSTFIKSAIIEFDRRDVPTFPEGNIVEWHASTSPGPPLDGFEILRRGDLNVQTRIILHVAHYPDRFKVLEPLASLLEISEGTRSEVLSSLWKYVKVVGAQDKEDGTVVRAVGGLQKIFPANQETLPFHMLPEVTTQFLVHPDPVTIPYTIDVGKEYNFHHKCFDIPIEMEDPLKSKMSSLVASFEGAEGKEIVKLEDKVGELAYFAREIQQKRDFLEGFAANPQAFINNWLAAQARDLDQMLGYQVGTAGINGGSVREEDLRRSDLFSMPWVDEAVIMHETARMDQERRAGRAR